MSYTKFMIFFITMLEQCEFMRVLKNINMHSCICAINLYGTKFKITNHLEFIGVFKI